MATVWSWSTFQHPGNSFAQSWPSGRLVLATFPEQRVRHMLQEAKPFLVITDCDEKEHLFYDENKICWSSLEQISVNLPDSPLSREEHYPMSSDPVEIILYTSGSTGLPKGVRIKNSSILNRLEWQWRQFPFSKEEETFCFKTAITFIDSMAELWGPLLNPEHPLPVLILPTSTSSNPQLLIPLLNQYKVGTLTLLPSLLKLILTYLQITNDSTSLKQLKTWVCSGETLPCFLAEEFYNWSERNGGSHLLCNFYGSTEIMGDVTFHVLENKQQIGYKGKVPIGAPVDNTMLYLLDGEMRQVDDGEIGELYVAGKHVAAGYVNNKDSFRFIENSYSTDPDYKILFKTGDCASVYKGILLFEGRTDSQIKVRGNRVDMSEIEASLNKLKEVEKGVAFCYNHGQADQQLVAFVQLNGLPTEPIEIEKLLSKSLPSYAIPKVDIMDQIPLLFNGKVDRKCLLHQYTQLARSNDGVQLDLNGLANEKRPAMRCLLSAIASVLPHAVPKPSPEANFYSIGGNSLNSVLTIAKLKEAGYSISVGDFVGSEKLLEIVNKMTSSTDGNRHSNKLILNKYKFDHIKKEYKSDIYRIMTDSYLKKGSIIALFDPPVSITEYIEMLDNRWPVIIKNPLSIVLKDVNTDEVISVHIAIELTNLPATTKQSRMDYMYRCYESVEGPIRETIIPKGKKILKSLGIGTDQRLSPQENIVITEALEWKLVDVARENGFNGIIAVNSHALTRQLSETVLNYKQLSSCQVNQFVAPDGTRPFKKADDSVILTCAFKDL